MLNFTAIVPTSWKKGLIITMLHRAKKVCSSLDLFNIEVENLREIFYKNGYPNNFFNNVLDKFMNRSILDESSDSSDTQRQCVLLKLPFVGEASYDLSKRLKCLIGDAFNVNVRVVFTTCKIGSYFSLKCKTPLSLLSNVVYEFSCQRDAGITYIGETKRNLITRVGEHLSVQGSNKTEIKTHIPKCRQCSGSDLNCESFKILKRCSNSFDVVIQEALLIKRFNPKLNKQLFNNGSGYTLKVF